MENVNSFSPAEIIYSALILIYIFLSILRFAFFKKKYRVKERQNIYHGRMFEVQEQFFLFMWASSFTSWLKNRQVADELVYRLNNGLPIKDITDKIERELQS